MTTATTTGAPQQQRTFERSRPERRSRSTAKPSFAPDVAPASDERAPSGPFTVGATASSHTVFRAPLDAFFFFFIFFNSFSFLSLFFT